MNRIYKKLPIIIVHTSIIKNIDSKLKAVSLNMLNKHYSSKL